jgi:hypothetical protein
MIRVPQREGQRMRTSAIGLVIALALIPTAAFAQYGPPGGQSGPPPGEAGPPSGGPGGPPPGPSGGAAPPGAITREQFVQRRAEAAGRQFDEIDVNHLGYITRAQLRAWMGQRRGGAGPGPGGPPPQQ